MVCSLQNKKVAVTGAAGLIGSNLCNQLHEEGYEVFAIDNLERGNREYLNPEIRFQKVDLRIMYPKSGLFHGHDAVIHLASKVGGMGYYLREAYNVLNESLLIDSNTLNCAIENKVSKYFYASTAHVYPSSLQQTINPIPLQEEQAYPSNPGISYGWSKLIGERQLKYAVNEGRIRGAIARLVGIYGKNQSFDLDNGSVIPVFCRRAIQSEEVPFIVRGNGKETRTYCYMDDALEAIKLMITKLDNQALVGPMNIGSEEVYSIGDIAEKIVGLSEKDISIIYNITEQANIRGQLCSLTRANRELNWKATTSLDEGLSVIYNDIKDRLYETS